MDTNSYTTIGGMFTVVGGIIHIMDGNKYLAMLGPIIGLILIFYGAASKSKKADK